MTQSYEHLLQHILLMAFPPFRSQKALRARDYAYALTQHHGTREIQCRGQAREGAKDIMRRHHDDLAHSGLHCHLQRRTAISTHACSHSATHMHVPASYHHPLPSAMYLRCALAQIWFNDWFNGDRGAVQETTVAALKYGTGFEMNGRQELYCMAQSGCWYTRFVDRQNCPPSGALQTIAEKAQSLTTMFETGSIGQRTFNLPTKECAYASRGQKLRGVCLYATPDPIDKLTILWHVDSTRGNGQNFGVALKTETMRESGKRERIQSVAEAEAEVSRTLQGAPSAQQHPGSSPPAPCTPDTLRS